MLYLISLYFPRFHYVPEEKKEERERGGTVTHHLIRIWTPEGWKKPQTFASRMRPLWSYTSLVPSPTDTYKYRSLSVLLVKRNASVKYTPFCVHECIKVQIFTMTWSVQALSPSLSLSFLFHSPSFPNACLHVYCGFHCPGLQQVTLWPTLNILLGNTQTEARDQHTTMLTRRADRTVPYTPSHV